MAIEYGALCTDFVISQRLALRMDLPSERETILGLFDRIRKERPGMNRLRRYNGEVALESTETRSNYEWMSLRRTSLRSGSVNPESFESARSLHRTILEVAPYFLTISPLDIAYLEVTLGFDLEAEVNRNEVVFEALLHGSPLAEIVDEEREQVIDCQPLVRFTLDEADEVEGIIDIKTRVRSNESTSGQYEARAITIDCAVRSRRPLKSINALPDRFDDLMRRVQQLADERVVPRLLRPIREIIMSRPS